MKTSLLFLLAFLFMPGITFSNDKVVISQWLTTSAQTLQLPAIMESENIKGRKFTNTDLLNFDHLDLTEHFPQNGKRLSAGNNLDLRWRSVFTDAGGYVFIDYDTTVTTPQVAYIAAYITTDRYLHTTLELKSPNTIRAWVNGEQIGTKTTTETDENMIGRVSKELKLQHGKHLLIIKTVRPEQARADWKIMASLEVREPFKVHNIGFSLEPVTLKTIHHILDGVKVTGINLSPDGKYYSVTFRQSLPPTDQSESWTEIRQVADKKIVQTFRHTARISQLQWLPGSNRISYVSTRERKSTLFLHDIEKGDVVVLMDDVENLTSYRWSPDEKHLIYSLREDGSSTTTDIRQVIGMLDRQPSFRNRNFLYQFDLASRQHRRLTFGSLTTSLEAICPDGSRIVFTQSFPDYHGSPDFSRQNGFMLHLSSMTLDTLWFEEPYSVSVRFSPDGTSLLATGGPSAFNGVGENIPEGTLSNNYDRQAYIFDLRSKQVKAITKNFDPAVESVHWSAADNHIYILTSDKDFRRVYRYDVRREQFTLLNLGFDYVDSMSFSTRAPMMVFRGSQTALFPRHYLVNLRNMRQQLMDESEAFNYRHVEFGKTKDWNFNTSTGLEITGRVYYPPDFDPDNKYPVIVYYYGGTTPVGRTFGGRYPFNLWAGNGYIVYIMQPSGAIGFGQEFSAAHQNNWGITVADEIIEGTKKFLEAHPYTNKEKVGCAGASYGGFMTMLLTTRTDIFAAAISHAGISSISSYWGEGYWGYAYSAEASGGSFPWNAKDLYVGQSPLFFADRVTTPLLLITGDSDTNVPPGESIQMYTALKILNRPVELVLVRGENHHIVTYNKRIQWHNAIMGWWDKHLKDQPEWWNEQFPEKNY